MKLKDQGVGAVVSSFSFRDQPSIYRSQDPASPVSGAVAKQLLNLPNWRTLQSTIQERVVAALEPTA